MKCNGKTKERVHFVSQWGREREREVEIVTLNVKRNSPRFRCRKMTPSVKTVFSNAIKSYFELNHLKILLSNLTKTSIRYVSAHVKATPPMPCSNRGLNFTGKIKPPSDSFKIKCPLNFGPKRLTPPSKISSERKFNKETSQMRWLRVRNKRTKLLWDDLIILLRDWHLT